MKTAQQVLQSFIKDRSQMQHEAATKAFIGKLPFRPATDKYTCEEVMGILAALIANGMKLQSKSEATQDLQVDAAGNKHHKVDLTENVAVKNL